MTDPDLPVAADDPGEPTPEMYAERARRADRATRGALAAELIFEALCVLLVPRALARTSYGLDSTKTTVLVALAVVLVLASGVLRRRWGIAVGTALQLLVMASAVLLPVFAVIAVVFWAIWGWLLWIRHQLVGTPGGLRLLVS